VADQQRREKLKKKIARGKEEMTMGKTAFRYGSRESGRLLPSAFGKNSLEAEDKDSLLPCGQQAPYLSKARSPNSKHGLGQSTPVKYARKKCQNTSKASKSNSDTSSARRKCSEHSCSSSTDSSVSIRNSKWCQGHNSKACSGDLLDRHSQFFTDSHKCFTPRILISDAKSSLSEYRYYTPPQSKRKNHRKRRVEAQMQTGVRSSPSAEKPSKRRGMAEQQKITLKAEDRGYTVDEPVREIAAFPYSFSRCLIYSHK
ncbi:SPAT7 protein, partial [Heliornis fulica]|nr:SPAT7 protein [Heliornis fulica]